MNTAVAESFEMSVVAALTAIRERDVSAQELTSRFLKRIESGNGDIGALRHTLADQAIEVARAMDVRIRAGEALPPLAGLPVVVKENCDTVGAPCSAGLSFRADHMPSTDSSITARLRAAGAIVLGVSVSDPGAFGVRTPDVTHPIDPTLTVGGSSGGSAAALAAGFCLGAIGTDTGGSIRIPSACCGTVGLKPTFGALPMGGIFPLIPSLDHVGPMARTVEDLALLWGALRDDASRDDAPTQKIGFDPIWLYEADTGIRDAFVQILELLKTQGVECQEVQLPSLDEISEMHGRIFFVEGAAHHYANFKEHIGSYPAIAQSWFAAALQAPVGDYVNASEKRVRFTNQVNRLLEDVDVILTPTLSVSRPRCDAEELTVSGKSCDFTMALVRQTCLFDHTGHPALAMPLNDSTETPPPSLQIVGRHRGESRILRFARALVGT
jgi:Asp-tRNA(Asn)/Glu-tRNA(Gln) amidotransferase A subunit family amidase